MFTRRNILIVMVTTVVLAPIVSFMRLFGRDILYKKKLYFSHTFSHNAPPFLILVGSALPTI